MKRTAKAICVAICLMISLLGISSAQAVDSAKQAELLVSCQKIQQYLALPPETSAEQRALVALNIAIAQAQPLDKSIDLAEVLHQASSFTTYLVQSDTFYLWETDHWEGNRRSTYTYSGIRETSEVEQDWTGASWVNAYQILWTYNGDGTPNKWTQQEWQTDQWVNVYLMSFTYSGGMTDTMLTQTWSGSAWENNSRSSLKYSGGNLATMITELWQTGAWVNAAKSSYTFDGGHLSELITEFWTSNTWANVMRYTLSYNEDGWETQSIMYSWQGGAWVNSSKNDYSYDGFGNEILDVYSIYDGENWMAMEADTSKWSGGKNTEVVHNHMLPSPEVCRTQYAYDAHGNRTEDLDQDWSGSEWVNSDRAVYVYQQFIMNSAPSAVTLIAPADSLITPLASLRPTFSWSASTDPDPYDTLTYNLRIALDTDFTSVEQQIPNLTDTSHTLTTDLLWGKRYWWKVKTNDPYGDSAWSTQVFTFRTMTLGDADNDGSITIADVVFLVEYIFSHGPAPSSYASGDADCDGEITIADAVYLIAYIFSQGSAPCAGSK